MKKEVKKKEIERCCNLLKKLWLKDAELNLPEILLNYVYHPDSFVDGCIFGCSMNKIIEVLELRLKHWEKTRIEYTKIQSQKVASGLLYKIFWKDLK